MEWVKIEVSGAKSLPVGAIYRPSVRDTDDLRHMMDSTQCLSSQTASHIWLTGDFKLPDIDWCQDTVNIKKQQQSESHEAFLDMLDAAAFTQTVREPTKDENILDLFSNNNETLITRCAVIPGISDHDAVLIESRLRPQKKARPTRHVPIWERTDWNGIKTHIETAWYTLPEEDKDEETAEHPLDWLTSTLKGTIKAFIRHRQTKKSERHQWISRPLKRLMKKEKRLYYRKRHKPTRCNINKLKRVQQQVQKRFRQEYWRYINGILFPAENQDPDNRKKTLWNYIKNYKKDSIGVASLWNCKTGELLIEAEDKAEVLNDQFQSVFSRCTPFALGQLCAQAARLLPQARTEKIPIYARLHHLHQWHKEDASNTEVTQSGGPRLHKTTHP